MIWDRFGRERPSHSVHTRKLRATAAHPPTFLVPLSLAACGGDDQDQTGKQVGSHNQQQTENTSPTTADMLIRRFDNALTSQPDISTAFSPIANVPNEKVEGQLDPAGYFTHSNKVHFFGFSDTTLQPAYSYAGIDVPERVVSHGPSAAGLIYDQSTGQHYFFVNDTPGYGSIIDGRKVPKLFLFDGEKFANIIPDYLPDLTPMRVGADNYVFAQENDYLGFVSTNTDSGNGLGGDILLLEMRDGQVFDRTGDLPESLSADLYGRPHAVNVHGMGVGDLTGNGRSDILLGDIDIGIYAMLQDDFGNWSVYKPAIFSELMYDRTIDDLPENYPLFQGQSLPRSDADFSQIYVLRGADDTYIAYHLDLRDVAKATVAENFELRPGDIVYVETRPISKLNEVLRLALGLASTATTLGSVVTPGQDTADQPIDEQSI